MYTITNNTEGDCDRLKTTSNNDTISWQKWWIN